MRTRLPTFALAILFAGAPLPAQDDAPPSSASVEVFQREVRPLLADLCFRCHGETKQKGSLRLDTLDPALPTAAVANHWRAVLDALQAGDMPPEEEPQPSVEQRRELVQWMQGALEGASERLRGEQRVVLRRLTREQYGNALQELLGLPIEIGARLPPEAKSKFGFSNSGEVLDASPLMLESMQEIARAALDQAIVSGERPAPSRYRVRFGRGIGKGHLAGVTGGYQAEPLTTEDFRLELLDVEGNELVPADEAQKKELEALRRRISVGFRGSSRERFRVVDEGLILLSGLPHREKPSESWQGPSPNVALEMQRCWPERGAFALRIEASRGYVPPLRKDLLLKLDERRPLASWSASEGLRAESGAIVLDAEAGDERENLREEEVEEGESGLLLVPVEVPKPSRVRFRVELPRDGYYQIDLVHRPRSAEGMPSVRLSAAGQNLDHRPFASPSELAEKRVVTALGAIGMRAGEHFLKLGGPFFVGVSQLVVTPMSEDHPLVQRLRAREKAQDEELSALAPVLRVYAGTRTDDGMDYLNFGAPREVHAPLGAPEVYEFFGRMENLPIPELDWVDREELSGFLLMGLWNDHLVKSPQQTGPPLLVRSIEFEAPWFESWPPRTHTEIFLPVEAFSLAEKSPARDGYTKVVLHLFLTRAFRRPAAPGEVERTFRIWKSIEDEHPVYEEGVKEVLLAILCSPHFLFLVEPEALGAPLSEQALATRLAFFLWNAPPDARLRTLADAGELRSSLVDEVDRLLADPRARNFVRSFASEWLRLDRHASMTLDPDRHPEYTRFVKRDLGEETVQYLLHVLRNDLPVRTLVDSDFALLNQNLAEYYGVPGVLGPEFRPVRVTPEQQRGGLLVQGSFLAGHSNGLEPHPIKRAVWLKERLLGSPPPPPPPNVPALDPATPGFEKLTLQEQLAAHRDKDACRDCHAGIDPFGVAFEQLSAAGRFEPQRKGRAVDARAKLPDGTEVDGLRGLRAWLLERKIDDVARSFLEHLYAYALGRDLSFTDEAALEALLEGVRADGYRARAFVHRIVTSQAFTHR
jgi:hypothetical protein